LLFIDCLLARLLKIANILQILSKMLIFMINYNAKGVM